MSLITGKYATEPCINGTVITQGGKPFVMLYSKAPRDVNLLLNMLNKYEPAQVCKRGHAKPTGICPTCRNIRAFLARRRMSIMSNADYQWYLEQRR